MENMESIIRQFGPENNITLEDIPDIDLYMDQVIQLFENKYKNMKRNENEKVLTKTMVNNYAKGKLFIPIKNKKYSKEHLLLISLIYQLKGALSINDIKAVLDGVNKKVAEGNFNLALFYNSYLHLADQNIAQFKEDVQAKEKGVHEEVEKLEDENTAYLENVLLITSLVNQSNLYRKAAEKLVDQIILEERQE
ncbi:DUF1836 domain-containing protein [Bacillus sp. V3B]|uniref:DUF1836 domain-containing protein n=1 Tax=Bacillus sp. V3B TaxID=2804915 RepID=UPI00210C67FB|nr:DUF1836 domain-containing protein [Bacillus sp. V3B]MCQ6276105.1 DUF1836 domain-containing protein [Bacillus sp. V3B]